MFTVVVTGSREWANLARIDDAMKWLHSKHGSDVRIVHGTARGADQLCASTARRYGFSVVGVPADWAQFGRSAGYRRNIQMLTDYNPDLVLAFWNGTSKGTKHTIDEAKSRGLCTYVVR